MGMPAAVFAGRVQRETERNGVVDKTVVCLGGDEASNAHAAVL